MRFFPTLLLSFIFTTAFAADTHTGAPQNLPTLFLIGDSTVNNSTKGLQGWGTRIADFFDTKKIRVANAARAGRSSRTFFAEGLWEKVRTELKPGDFVLMQFGHNDNGPVSGEFAPGRPARSSIKGNGEETQEVTLADGKTETVHTFGWYLRKYAADTTAKGATPVILSPVPRNDWHAGKVARTDAHVKWSAEAAATAGVAFVDLNAIIADRYDALGQEKVKPLFPQEHTHTSPDGARLNAACVADGLRAMKPPLLSRFLLPAAAVK
jgi:rhamnogalacturonan acetylesterase